MVLKKVYGRIDNNLHYSLENWGFSPLKPKGENMTEKPKEWKKIEREIFKFENEGDSIEGELLKIEPSETYKNKIYTIRTSEGDKVVFGTAVIDSELSIVPVGSEIKILFVGTKESKVKGQNPLKLFDIYVK